MKTIYPPKLKPGDEIRIVAPSSSLRSINKSVIKLAEQRLKQLGFKISYGKYVSEKDDFGSTSIKNRISDFEAAFSDNSVRMVLAVRGGYNANQLLDYIDYDLIPNNPKILCGFSDITVLSNAIYAKTGLVTYSGPNMSSFGMQKGFEYTQNYFLKCLTGNEAIEVKSSKSWSDDRWYKDQNKRTFKKNSGFYGINSGKVQGIIIGGNLCSLNLLQGTKYMPPLKGSILFLEEDDLPGKNTLEETDRNLLSLLQSSSGIAGLVLGRFQKNSSVRKQKLVKMIKNSTKLKNIPVIADADFGHTTPQFTFPIGGKAVIDIKHNQIKILILKY